MTEFHCRVFSQPTQPQCGAGKATNACWLQSNHPRIQTQTKDSGMGQSGRGAQHHPCEAAKLPPLRLPTCISLKCNQGKNLRQCKNTHVVRMVVIWSMKPSNSTRRSSQLEKRQRSYLSQRDRDIE